MREEWAQHGLRSSDGDIVAATKSPSPLLAEGSGTDAELTRQLEGSEQTAAQLGTEQRQLVEADETKLDAVKRELENAEQTAAQLRVDETKLVIDNRMQDRVTFVRFDRTQVKGARGKWSQLRQGDRVTVSWRFVDKPKKAYVVQVLRAGAKGP